MKTERLNLIQTQIEEIKRELITLGEMRPGSLTQQHRKGCSTGEYYQLSYTHRMKGKTEYVRKEFAPKVREQILTFRRFRKLTQLWVKLAILHAQLKMKLEKKPLEK